MEMALALSLSLRHSLQFIPLSALARILCVLLYFFSFSVLSSYTAFGFFSSSSLCKASKQYQIASAATVYTNAVSTMARKKEAERQMEYRFKYNDANTHARTHTHRACMPSIYSHT